MSGRLASAKGPRLEREPEDVLLSVIIPTFNRARRVGDLLDSLDRLEAVSFEWEVIVVDNGSTDDMALLVQRAERKGAVRIRYVVEDAPGLHEGRHRGAREARGDYLAYLDDDMLLAPGWLTGVRRLLDGSAGAVVGRILPKWEATPPRWLGQMAAVPAFGYLSLLDLGRSIVETDHFFGCNLFISKDTVFRLGGFNPDGMPAALLKYRGDGETGLWLKFHSAGMRLLYDPEALAFHVVPPERMTVEYLRGRAYRQGISASFSDLRARLQPGETTGPLRGVASDARAWLGRRWPVGVARFCRSYLAAATQTDREIAHVRLLLATSFARGWAFHRAAVRRDPNLRRHVGRRTFMND